MNIPLSGLGLSSKEERVDHGIGYVRERTVEIGNTVIAVENIGSIKMFDGHRTHGLTILGVAALLLSFTVISTSGAFGLLLLLAGIGLIAWNFLRPVDCFLSIGTSDGRSVSVVSKNKVFLAEISGFLRKKLDALDSQVTGTINISNTMVETQGGPYVSGNAEAVLGANSSIIGRRQSA